MKKINYLLLTIMLLLVGIVSVDAKTYTSYEVGDEITVNVNSSTKLKFYVIEDSTTESVTAIYSSVSDTSKTYTYEEALTAVNTLKTTWSNVESISIPTMEQLFGEDVDLTDSFNFTEPEWVFGDKYTYWTSTEVENDENEKIYWYLSFSMDGVMGFANNTANESSFVRPVITVLKDHVEGGIEIDNSTWESLKENVIKNDTIGMLDNDEYKVEFLQPSDKVLEITVSKKDDSVVYLVTLNYNDGVMTYSTPSDEPEGFELIHSIVIQGVLEEFCKLYDYDFDSFMAWLEENRGKLTLVGNGITYSMQEYSYESEVGSINGDYINKLSINIAYPITGYSNPSKEENNEENEDKEENPSTGDLDMIIVASTMIFFVGASVIAYKKRTN